jgi:hypothetical protein
MTGCRRLSSKNPMMYKSVCYSNREALDAINGLYLQGELHLDVCYAKGDFYKGAILRPEVKHDTEIKAEGVYAVDCREMPYPDNCVRSIMFDPPWLIGDGSFGLAKKYGAFPSAAALFAFQDSAIREMARVLVPGGWLIGKVQDCSHGRQKYFLSVYQVNKARDYGLYLVDSIILVNKNRLRTSAAGRISTISNHCFFNVYRKQQRRKRVDRY